MAKFASLATVGMLCPAAPSMTVPTVAMMPKKKNGAHNRGKRNRGTEQAFAETLRYLADDWGRLSPEELARFLCEYCQSNPEINAFCRTIALHFRAKRGGKRSKSGPDKQWTHDRLRELAVDFVTCEITHPKKRKSGICKKLTEKGSRWAGLSSETLRKRLQEAEPRRGRYWLPFYRYIVRLLISDDPLALGKARIMMGHGSPILREILSRLSTLDTDTRRKLLEEARYWPEHGWDFWCDGLLQKKHLSRLDANTRQKLRELPLEQSWAYFHNVLLPQSK